MNKIKHLLPLNFFLLISIAGFSQSHLMKELDKIAPTHQENKTVLIPIKSTLPPDLWKEIGTSFIGISDVKLDSASAYHQAYLRALSIYSLQNGMARGMSDFYKNEYGAVTSSNYEEICELKAHCKLPLAALRIKNSVRLKSGELILFLTVDSTEVNKDTRIQVNSSTSIYYKENERDGNHHIMNKILLENELIYSEQAKKHTEKSTYLLSNNRWTNKEVFFDNTKIENDQYRLFYDYSNAADTSKVEYNGSTVTTGLWTALINSLYSQLSAQLKPQFQKIKTVGERSESLTNSLNRESGFVSFGCTIEGIVMKDNKLEVKVGSH